MPSDPAAFDGAKVALFVGDRLVVLRRDARMDVAWPGALDWPGGGAEPGETPVDTAIRETVEEVGIKLTPDDFGPPKETERLGVRVVKMSAHLPESRAAELVLGDEGQALGLMTPEEFIAHSDAVPALVTYLRTQHGMGWPAKDARVPCRTPAEGRDGVTNIPAWKFNLMRFLLRELVRRAGPEGLPFKGLAARVSELMHAEDRARLGSVGWHMTSVKLELEVRGELARHAGKGPQRIVPGPVFLDVVTSTEL
ncbi:DUF6958 family protein [Pseudaestuariivita sp.]|uniref:DUF6958 family protein n=1 Tax=Pseudaestuariivita sp. TaxID=2211669 RepID=UPI004058BE2A